MALETFTYISSFNSANPVSSDNASQGDDHIRGMKAAILATFPNVTGAVTPTHTSLNAIAGTQGTLYNYGYAADSGQGVIYFTSGTSKYLLNNGTNFVLGGQSFYCSHTIEGNGGGGNGLGKITVSTSAPSGGAAGDIWIQY